MSPLTEGRRISGRRYGVVTHRRGVSRRCLGSKTRGKRLATVCDSIDAGCVRIGARYGRSARSYGSRRLKLSANVLGSDVGNECGLPEHENDAAHSDVSQRAPEAR